LVSAIFTVNWITRFFFLLLLAPLLRAQSVRIEASMESYFLVQGEEVVLTISVEGMNVSGFPATPAISPLTLRQLGSGKQLVNRRVTRTFTYGVSSVKTGTFVIPSFRLGGAQTKAMTLHVMDRSQLKKEAFMQGGQTFHYYSAVFVANTNPYLGETQVVEAKLYIPSDVRMIGPHYADFDKKDAVAWRFDPVQSSGGGFRQEGQIYRATSYRSALTPLKAGDLSFGPGTAETLMSFRVSHRGRLFWERQSITCHFPALSLNVQALPEPQPAGYTGAVGDFRLTASLSGRDIKVGDPMTVELQVSGTGNLDQLAPPRLLDDADDFKQFDISKKAQGSERRSATGTVEFSQVIRPTRVTDQLPPYELVFFDPTLKKYRSTVTPAIPLSVAPAPQTVEKAPPEPGSSLAYLPPGSKTIPAISTPRPIWFWQIIPALLALYLIAKKLTPTLAHKQKQSQISKEFDADLDAAMSSSDRVSFYRSSAQFLDRWTGQKAAPEGAEEIVRIRDEICFSPDSPAEPIPPKEKSAVREVLRQLAPLLILPLLLFPDTLHADRQEKLAEALANPTPEAFYNLGLEEEKAENHAAAALYYYRHEAYAGKSEALEPLLRRISAIRRIKPRGMEMISLIPRPFFEQCGFAFLWGLGLLLLVFILRARRWLPFLLPITIIAGALWLLAKVFYPRDISFLPLRELSVIMSDEDLRDAPFAGSITSRNVPLGSIAAVTSQRGEWVFIELPSGSAGWLPKASVAPIAGREVPNPSTSQKD